MLHFTRLLSLVALLAGAIATPAQNPSPASPRERLSLDRAWMFHEGDVPFPVITGHQQSYNNAKAGSSWGAASPSFDDSSWKQVNLPHDWAVEQPFDEKANISQGYRARGMGWYRKYFRLDPADHGKHLEIQLDGIATHCTVWVNGVLAARNWCGYTSVYVDITPFAKFGSDVNVLAVQVDANTQEGWWYEGAGLYRHTWLVKRNPVHVITDGVYANPVCTNGAWTLPVEVTLENSGHDLTNADVAVVLIDPAGKEIAFKKVPATVTALAQSVVKLSLPVSSPKLWSVDEPTLYSVRTVVLNGKEVLDQVTTTCGFRTIRFDADKGFFLNEQPVKLMGTCNHQDMAGVGVAVPDSIWDFRVRRLKEMGANAFRCAHNPPAAEFLAACDRLGMLVMDENRNFGSSPEYLEQLEWMVRRDRNHPSVILWSVFNEEPSQGSEMGYEMVRRMSAVVKKFDLTRPVTAAQSSAMLNAVNASQAADVSGFNYQWQSYDAYHKQNPTKPMFSSEDTSAVMTRDEYATNRRGDNPVLSSYDDQIAGGWATSHRNAWKQIATRPFVAGTMVWTGFDYRGEPQPLPWPSAGSSFGCMDLCGFPKAAYYLHQAQWIQNRPILQLIPHWNWAGSEGKPIKVMAFSNAEKIALLLNGKLLEEKPVDKFEMVTFDVPYEEGKLEAVASTGGKEVARFAVETTGAAAGLKLIADRASLAGDGNDAQPVKVQVVDAQGRIVPTANQSVKFELNGAGAIIGLNNGDPNCHEPEKGNQHSVFHGLAQVILQSALAGSGKLTLRATSEGLAPAEITIDVTAAPALPAVPVAHPTFVVRNWRMSPVSAVRPEPNQKIGDSDMNTWASIQPGRRLPSFNGGSFAIFRAQFTPHAGMQKSGGKINFPNVTGNAQVWLDGKLVAEKTDPERKSFSTVFPPGDGERTINIVIESPASDMPAGLGGAVTIE